MSADTADRLTPGFGTYTADTYRTGHEPAVWGARLIAPADLVANRMDIKARSSDAEHDLIEWLNGGAIAKMRERARELGIGTPHGLLAGLDERSEKSVVLYEDDQGMMVGSPQASCGHVYVTGWLKG